MSERRRDIYDEGALRILEAVSAVDEELLERCGMLPEPAEAIDKVADISKYRNRRPLWKMSRVWAACLGFLAIGVISWYGLRVIAPKGTADSSDGGVSGEAMDDANFNTSVSAPEAMFIGEEEDETAADDIMKETAGTGGKKYSEDNTDALSRDEAGGMEQQSVMSEKFGDEEELMDDRGNSGSSAIIAGTEEEARGWMPLGAYIPQDLPKGYRAESAFINLERQSVTMTWLRGMDYITVSVSSVGPGTVETVDISKPETYDQRLYKVPYAKTVPREYRETVDDPVFDFSDMDSKTGLELVSSRMISYDDAGDTDTPRGNFSVLIDDEVLLHFSGRGTPEEVWNMLCSIEK